MGGFQAQATTDRKVHPGGIHVALQLDAGQTYQKHQSSLGSFGPCDCLGHKNLFRHKADLYNALTIVRRCRLSLNLRYKKLDQETWLCRTHLDTFWFDFGPYWTKFDIFGTFCLLGPFYLDPSIWICLFGPVYLDLSLLTHMF